MAELLTPDCPLCGEPPVMMIGGGTQAVCGNDGDCPLIFWDATKSLDENLLDAGVINFPEANTE